MLQEQQLFNKRVCVIFIVEDVLLQPSKLRPFLVAMATKSLELATKLELKSPAW